MQGHQRERQRPVQEHLRCFEKKSDKDFRLRYLQKLTYSEVWLPPSKQVKSHQNLFNLDWDDTLFTTSFFLKAGTDYQNLEAMAKKNM